MNITDIQNPTSHALRRLSIQHLTLVSGLVLAVCSALALGGWQGSAAVTEPAVGSSRAPVVRQAESDLVYYLVASQQQVDQMIAIEREVLALAPGSDRTARVLRVTSSEEERAALKFLSDLSYAVAENPRLSVVDMR